MNASQTAERLLQHLGGKENVLSNEACMTRLRVGVRDMSLVDEDALGGVDGVLGVVCADTLQIVFGPGKVNAVLEAFSALTGIPRGAAQDGALQAAKRNKDLQAGKHAGTPQAFLKHVANIFVPLLPGIIAAGLVNGITNVVNAVSGGALSGLWWYESVRTMGWALFAYLPIRVWPRSRGGERLTRWAVRALPPSGSSIRPSHDKHVSWQKAGVSVGIDNYLACR